MVFKLFPRSIEGQLLYTENGDLLINITLLNKWMYVARNISEI